MEDESEILKKSFSDRSIRVIASRLGIDDLDTSVSRHISKEASYKTNELIYTAKKIMHRNKRSVLTTDDIQKAMSLLGGVQIYGHDNSEPSNFMFDPSKSVFREYDSEINLVNLALEGRTARNECFEPRMQGNWILADDSSLENDKCDPYYAELAKTILLGNPTHVQVVLKDLRTNSKIGPISQFFLNFIAATLEKTKDVTLVDNLLDAVHSLAINPFIDPNPYQAVSNAFEAVLSVAIRTKDPEEWKDWSDLSIRTKSGLLVEKLLSSWTIELKQHYKTTKTLAFCLKEGYRPLQAHYGAILTLTAMAPSLPPEALQMYWQEIENYFAPILPDSALADDNVKHLMIVILVAWRNECKVEKLLYDIFGDSVVPFRMPWSARSVYLSNPPKAAVGRTRLPQPKLKLRFGSSATSGPEWFVHRSLKYCRPSHMRSPVGDISLIL